MSKYIAFTHPFQNMRIEVTKQHLEPFAATSLQGMREDVPLTDLEPAFLTPSGTIVDTPPFAFSNDGNAGYFEQLTGREQTAPYQLSRHRVFLSLGEGSLAAALPHIPEKTVGIVDSNPAMLLWMRYYVHTLRTAEDRAAFRISAISHDDIAAEMQIRHWKSAGKAHPFTSDVAFAKAQTAARDKTFFFYGIDLRSPHQTHSLRSLLLTRGARITAANISNVIAYNKERGDTSIVQNLIKLPFTPEAPILATSQLDESVEDQDEFACAPVGPFFGTQNLLRAHRSTARFTRGKRTHHSETQQRRYIEREPPLNSDSQQRLAAAIALDADCA